MNTFVAESIFRQRDFADKSVDAQIIIKMAVWGLTFAFCAYFIKFWALKLVRLDKFCESALLLIVFISCFYAPNIPYSLASAFSLIAVFFLLFMSSVFLSNRQILAPIIYGCSLVSFISLIVYFVDPDFGRMKEWYGNLHLIGSRMTGITGTANAIGYIAGFACVALFYFRCYLPRRVPMWFWLLVAVNVIDLLLSNSRTALVATVFSILIGQLVVFSPAKFAVFFLSICAAIAVIFMVDLNSVFEVVSRSGDSSEITSGTGRAAIWSTTIMLIGERPLLGWGYASSIFVLPTQSILAGYAAPHAHNAFLQVLFSIGIIGFLFFAAVLVVKFYFALKHKDPLNLSFLMYLLIDGMLEPIAFQGPVTTTALALAAILSLKYRESYETNHLTH